MKTTRNINDELFHNVYYDMENGNDKDSVDIVCLIELLTEIVSRLEAIECKLNNLESFL